MHDRPLRFAIALFRQHIITHFILKLGLYIGPGAWLFTEQRVCSNHEKLESVGSSIQKKIMSAYSPSIQLRLSTNVCISPYKNCNSRAMADSVSSWALTAGPGYNRGIYGR